MGKGTQQMKRKRPGGYLSEPGVVHHHNGVGHSLGQIYQEGKKRWSTWVKQMETRAGDLPSGILHTR